MMRANCSNCSLHPEIYISQKKSLIQRPLFDRFLVFRCKSTHLSSTPSQNYAMELRGTSRCVFVFERNLWSSSHCRKTRRFAWIYRAKVLAGNVERNVEDRTVMLAEKKEKKKRRRRKIRAGDTTVSTSSYKFNPTRDSLLLQLVRIFSSFTFLIFFLPPAYLPIPSFASSHATTSCTFYVT